MSLNSIDQICTVCSCPAAKRCLACQKIYYCSQEHQKADWERHKENCPPYKIERNDIVGRFLVATRNISKGTIIFREKPLVFGPKIYSRPTCLGCHKRVNGSYFCSRCGYPMCSRKCENVPMHKENECKIFEKKSSKPKNISNYDVPNAIYQSILVLRCLLLGEKNPEKWNLLSSMEHHVDKRRNTSEVWNEYQVNIVKFLRIWNDLKDDFSDELINKVIGFIEVNSFQICTVNQEFEFCGMFFLAGMMSHNCVPNTHHAFDKEGSMIMRASVPIKKGEEITNSYVDTELGTLERQRILQHSKYFTCQCSRCADPSELGTFISGVKCSSCKSGYLLPENPFDLNSSWKCHGENIESLKTGCNQSTNIIQIKELLSSVELEINGLGTDDSEESLTKCLKLGGSFLHPNHYFLLPKRNSLVKLFKKSHYNCSDTTVLSQQQTLITDLLQVYNIICPGLNRARGLLLLQQLNIRKRILELRLMNGDIPEGEEVSEKSYIANLEKELEKLFELDLMIGTFLS